LKKKDEERKKRKAANEKSARQAMIVQEKSKERSKEHLKTLKQLKRAINEDGKTQV